MLNIKRPETYDLAKQVAERTGLSLTDAVTEALRDKLKALNEGREEDVAARVARVLTHARQWRDAVGPDLPTRDDLDAETYDEDGLPR